MWRGGSALSRALGPFPSPRLRAPAGDRRELGAGEVQGPSRHLSGGHLKSVCWDCFNSSVARRKIKSQDARRRRLNSGCGGGPALPTAPAECGAWHVLGRTPLRPGGRQLCCPPGLRLWSRGQSPRPRGRPVLWSVSWEELGLLQKGAGARVLPCGGSRWLGVPCETPEDTCVARVLPRVCRSRRARSGDGDGGASTPALPAVPAPASRRSGWGLLRAAVPDGTEVETGAGAL